MPQKQGTLFHARSITAFLILLVTGCAGSGEFTNNAKIQNDITIAVNNYNSDNWETRLDSIKKISRYSNTVYAKNSFLLIFKALDDSHSEVRIEALKILKPMKAPAAEKKIRSMALLDENPNVRVYAYSALEEYRNLTNEEIFTKGLQENDWLVKEAALKGLMKINDTEIQTRHIDDIVSAIKDKNISIKLTAISNINIRNPLIYAELAKIVKNKGSSLFVLKAALVKIKEYKLDPETKQRVIELLTSRDKNVRILSLQVLKQNELNADL